MMFETAENRVLEWRATVAVCQNGAKKRVLDVCAGLFAVFPARHAQPAGIILKLR